MAQTRIETFITTRFNIEPKLTKLYKVAKLKHFILCLTIVIKLYKNRYLKVHLQ